MASSYLKKIDELRRAQLGYRKALADHLLSEMRSTSRSASWWFLLSSSVLLLAWLGSIEPVFQKDIIPLRSTLSQLRRDNEDLKNNLDRLILDLESVQDVNNEVGLKARDVDSKRKSDIEARLQINQKSIDDLILNIKEIEIGIPGLPKVSVRPPYAPLIWSSFATLLLLYLSVARYRALRFVSSSLRIYVTELKVAHPEMDEYGSGLVWWMKPFPWKDGMLKADALRQFLGKNSSYWQNLWLVACLSILIGAQARMMYLLWISRRSLEYDSVPQQKSGFYLNVLGINFPFSTVLLTIELGVIVICLFLIFQWVSISTVPDYRHPEVSPNKLSRRDIVLSASLISASLAIFPLRSMGLLPRNPRFKKRKAQVSTNLKEGFYQNLRSNIYHYAFVNIPYASTQFRLPKINQRNLIAVEVAKVTVSNGDVHINKARASASCEEAALVALRSDEIEKAFSILFAGLRYSEGSYRLADLLAGLAIRYDKPDYLNQLILSITPILEETYQNYNDRKEKWNNPNSKWWLRWADRSRKVFWASVPM